MTEKLRIAGEHPRPIVRRESLTEAGVGRLACPAARRRVYVYDARVPGLAVQVTAAGARSYYFIGRVQGERQSIKHRIGDARRINLDTARRAAIKISSDAAHGVNPGEARAAQREAERKSITLSDLWALYRDQHLKVYGRPSTLRTDGSLWRLRLSAWSAKRVDRIKPADVVELHAELTASSTANSADKAVKLLRRMLTYGKVTPNPAARTVKFHGDKERQRFLTRDEAGRLLIALERSKYRKVADAIRFALFTGARSGNVRTARWRDIHLDRGIWIVPEDQSKNRKPITINLPPPAVALLLERQAAVTPGAVYVFPGHVKGRPLTSLSSAWRVAKKAAKIEDCRLHDLRHTLASWMAMEGASLLVVGRQLGHASKQSTARYTHLEVDAVKQAAGSALAAFLPPGKPEGGK